MITAWQSVQMLSYVMCTAIVLAELSCQQHSPEFSIIGGAELAYSFLED